MSTTYGKADEATATTDIAAVGTKTIGGSVAYMRVKITTPGSVRILLAQSAITRATRRHAAS